MPETGAQILGRSMEGFPALRVLVAGMVLLGRSCVQHEISLGSNPDKAKMTGEVGDSHTSSSSLTCQVKLLHAHQDKLQLEPHIGFPRRSFNTLSSPIPHIMSCIKPFGM